MEIQAAWTLEVLTLILVSNLPYKLNRQMNEEYLYLLCIYVTYKQYSCQFINVSCSTMIIKHHFTHHFFASVIILIILLYILPYTHVRLNNTRKYMKFSSRFK